MLRLRVEIDGHSIGDLYRQVRHLAEEMAKGIEGGDGEYVTGFGDGPLAPYFFSVDTIEEEN